MNARTRLATLASVSALALVGLAGCGDEAQDPASADSTPTRAAEPGDDPTEPSESASESTARHDDGAGLLRGRHPAGTAALPRVPQGRRRGPARRGAHAGGLRRRARPRLQHPPPGRDLHARHDGREISIPLPDDSWTQRPDGMARRGAARRPAARLHRAGRAAGADPIAFTDSDGNATQIFGIASEDGSRPPTRSRRWPSSASPARSRERRSAARSPPAASPARSRPPPRGRSAAAAPTARS